MTADELENILKTDFDRLFQERIEEAFRRFRSKPNICGDPARLHISEKAPIVDAHLNVNSGRIFIGKDTFFGFGVALHAGTHDHKAHRRARMEFPTEGCDIVIGEGVWIASRAIILGPCHIGDHAVVAAGAVVLPNTNIPPNALYAGNPAKLKKLLPPGL
jgi:acetyltransferase-like isoleucine patch superfamily enzyme